MRRKKTFREIIETFEKTRKTKEQKPTVWNNYTIRRYEEVDEDEENEK